MSGPSGSSSLLLRSCPASAWSRRHKRPSIPLLRDISPEVITIAVYYKENVHDPADQRIGRIVDLVIKPDRTVPAAIVSVGGFSASHQNMSRSFSCAAGHAEGAQALPHFGYGQEAAERGACIRV
jgi:hypothetical protein